MSRLFVLPGAVKSDPVVEAWFAEHTDELGAIAQHWFEFMRNCGDDVTEIIHDGQPTVCVGEAAFAYVDAFKAHVNVGFFHGSDLPDPNGILEGTGKHMRHVKVRPDTEENGEALSALIEAAYFDLRSRLESR